MRAVQLCDVLLIYWSESGSRSLKSYKIFSTHQSLEVRWDKNQTGKKSGGWKLRPADEIYAAVRGLATEAAQSVPGLGKREFWVVGHSRGAMAVVALIANGTAAALGPTRVLVSDPYLLDKDADSHAAAFIREKEGKKIPFECYIGGLKHRDEYLVEAKDFLKRAKLGDAFVDLQERHDRMLPIVWQRAGLNGNQ